MKAGIIHRYTLPIFESFNANKMSLILSDDEDSLGNFSSSPSSLSSETVPLEHLPFNETKTCTISTSSSTLIISKGYEDEDKNIVIKDEKDRDGHLVENKNR
jgi:hypothetical protein